MAELGNNLVSRCSKHSLSPSQVAIATHSRNDRAPYSSVAHRIIELIVLCVACTQTIVYPLTHTYTIYSQAAISSLTFRATDNCLLITSLMSVQWSSLKVKVKPDCEREGERERQREGDRDSCELGNCNPLLGQQPRPLGSNWGTTAQLAICFCFWLL